MAFESGSFEERRKGNPIREIESVDPACRPRKQDRCSLSLSLSISLRHQPNPTQPNPTQPTNQPTSQPTNQPSNRPTPGFTSLTRVAKHSTPGPAENPCQGWIPFAPVLLAALKEGFPQKTPKRPELSNTPDWPFFAFLGKKHKKHRQVD